MKKTKQILSVFLSLCMIVSCMVGLSVTASAEGITTFEALQAAVNAAENGTETKIELGGNITDMTSYLNVPEGKIIVLNLKGRTIDRKLTGETANGSVIYNSGPLTITDSGTGGTITGGWTTGNGGGVTNEGILTMSGGTISDNTTKYGGGVYSGDNGTATFIMSGGTIINNTATENGGGAYNSNNSTCTISGTATIDENTSAKGGSVYNIETLTMPGGTVTSVTNKKGVMNISGAPVTAH